MLNYSKFQLLQTWWSRSTVIVILNHWLHFQDSNRTYWDLSIWNINTFQKAKESSLLGWKMTSNQLNVMSAAKYSATMLFSLNTRTANGHKYVIRGCKRKISQLSQLLKFQRLNAMFEFYGIFMVQFFLFFLFIHLKKSVCHKILVCFKDFPSSAELKEHLNKYVKEIQKIRRESKYLCPVCHRGFDHKRNRTFHMRTIHGKSMHKPS